MSKFSVTKKDFDVSWFSGTGGGGQHRNKHMNCCRLKHRDTGIIKTGQSNKDRQANQREAIQAMAKDRMFMAFCSLKLSEIEKGKTIEQQVDEMMHEDNLKIECQVNGKWQDVS